MSKKIGQPKKLSKNLKILKELARKNQISTSEILLRLSESAEKYFVTETKEVFATITVANTSETVNVNSSIFESWLRNQYYVLLQKSVSNSKINEVISTISARHLMSDTAKKKTYLRICKEDEKLYIDLMSSDQRAVVIDEKGWSIRNHDIEFERPVMAKPIPIPSTNGDIGKLRKYLKMDDDNYKLVLAFIVGCYMPNGSYPILVIQGGQGSGKTTLSRLIKNIVDPSHATVLTAPKNEQDLLIAALNNHLLAFDNLSGVKQELSDAFCKLSTGSAFLTKMLYTDKEASLLSAKRPQILNGIDYIATRNDLADRSIIIHLPKVDDTERIPESEFWREFNRDLPEILGGIYNILSVILANYDSVKLTRHSRMADFTKWVTAAEEELGFKDEKFIDVYERNKNIAALDALESDILANCIHEIMKNQKELLGTSTFLVNQFNKKLDQLGISYKDNWLPINKLKDNISRIEPLLNRLGINYEYKRSKDRIHRLYREDKVFYSGGEESHAH